MYIPVVLKAVLDDFQNWILSVDSTIPLLSTQYVLDGNTYEKCYYYSPNLEFDDRLVKKISSYQGERFIGILFDRSPVEAINYRRHNVRAYSKLFISTNLPVEDYSGKMRIVSMGIKWRIFSNNYDDLINLEEYFVIDKVGREMLTTAVQLQNGIDFQFILNYESQIWEENSVVDMDKRLYTGSGSFKVEFPLVILREPIKYIKEINEVINLV